MENKKLLVLSVLVGYAVLALLFSDRSWANFFDQYISRPLKFGVSFSNEDDLETRLKILYLKCGDLCDTNKQIYEGDFLGSVSSKVKCTNLFTTLQEFSDSAPNVRPLKWESISEEVQDFYNYKRRVKTSEWYIDEAYTASDNDEPTVFREEDIQKNLIDPLVFNGEPVGNPGYPNSGNILLEAVNYINVTNKRILVIGTQTPWVEAILLANKPKKILTLEYGSFKSTHPDWSFIKPREFREKFLQGRLDTFDVVFSYSSLEHSGLGRYGDPVNPWADIMTVAQAYCVTSPDAKFAIAVPTSVTLNEDYIPYNAHRIYGPVMYPFLMTNWKFIWPTDETKRRSPPDANNGIFQPVFVFQKQNQFRV